MRRRLIAGVVVLARQPALPTFGWPPLAIYNCKLALFLRPQWLRVLIHSAPQKSTILPRPNQGAGTQRSGLRLSPPNSESPEKLPPTTRFTPTPASRPSRASPPPSGSPLFLRDIARVPAAVSTPSQSLAIGSPSNLRYYLL